MDHQNMCLYEKTVQYIADIIGKNLGNTNFKLPTEAELSASLGVSRMTATKAYKVINETGAIVRIKSKGTFISPSATRDSLAALLAPAAPQRPVKLIGVLLPSTTSTHTLNILSGITDSVKDCQYVVANTEMSQEVENRHIQTMLSKGVDGLILYPVDDDHYNSSLLNLALKNFPVVLVDRDLPGLNFACVSSDNKDMVEKSLRCLIENGNRGIMLYNANRCTPNSIKLRKECYIETLQKNNILSQYLFNQVSEDDEKAIREFKEYLTAHPSITAILAIDYTSSFRLKKTLESLRIRTPQDMEAVYIDIDADNYASIFAQTPTHISQNSFQIGKLAVETLLARLENPQAPRGSLYVKANFVKGNTTK